MYYLEQLTSGKPKDIVGICLHLPPGKGYREDRKLLEKRYGNKSKVATALVSQILAWRFIDSEDVNGLDEFSIFLRGCLNSLKNIPHGMTEVDARTIRQILSRLPIYVTDKWREDVDSVEISESRTPDFVDFVIFIEKKLLA